MVAQNLFKNKNAVVLNGKDNGLRERETHADIPAQMLA